MVPNVTPIPVLRLEGVAAVYPDRIEIGKRNILEAVRDALSRGTTYEHCGGDQRECSKFVCGLYELVLSAVPS